VKSKSLTAQLGNAATAVGLGPENASCPNDSNVLCPRPAGQARLHRRLRAPAALSPIVVLPYAALLGLLLAACADPGTPSEVSVDGLAAHFNHNAAAGADKGYIDGWLDGEDVSLHYTKWFFCAEPPSSGAASECVIGADAEVYPRPGPIPTIYAIAAAGIQPDPATLACPAGSVCLNHPAMLDASRVAGPGATNIPGVPHSHIVTERRGGWWHTVNIRVFDLDVWNEIAAAKSLTRVRELQADPAVGGASPPLISQDTPTNIFFFLQVQPKKPGN
jgi:hypothetical protein